MNLVLEKQQIKQEIDNLTDESILMSIKKLLGLAKERHLSPISKDELIARALESEKDIREGNVISLEDLEKEMKNW